MCVIIYLLQSASFILFEMSATLFMSINITKNK